MEFYPLQETTLWLQWCAFGTETFGYHLTNVLLHVLGALLLWRFFAQLGLRHGWLGGLLFVVHPANVESVAWISELKNTLSLPPFLVAMTALLRFYETKRPRDYALALATFTLALLVKISMAPFPFAILLYAWWRNGRVTPRDARIAAPFLAVAVLLSTLTVYAYLRFGALHPDHPLIPPIGGPLARLALGRRDDLVLFHHIFFRGRCCRCMRRGGSIRPRGSTCCRGSPGWRSWRGFGRAARHSAGTPLLGLGFFLLMIAPFCGLATQSYMYFTWVMDHFLYLAMIGPDRARHRRRG